MQRLKKRFCHKTFRFQDCDLLIVILIEDVKLVVTERHELEFRDKYLG